MIKEQDGVKQGDGGSGAVGLAWPLAPLLSSCETVSECSASQLQGLPPVEWGCCTGEPSQVRRGGGSKHCGAPAMGHLQDAIRPRHQA